MIELPDVTLICVTGINRSKHQIAIDISCEEIKWGDVKLVYDSAIDSIDKWNKYMVYHLGDHVKTSHAMVIHADGYVINPDLWNPDWLKYDFIGAPFPMPTDSFSYRDRFGNIQRVGNSVSLRSKKLMSLPKQIGMEWKPFFGYYNEDGFISVNNRHIFEENGCKYAPLEVAVHFSKEHSIPENQGIETFAFHALG